MKLPKVLYVRLVKEGDKTYLIASPDLAESVVDGETNLIGTSWLKEKPHKYEKVVSARD